MCVMKLIKIDEISNTRERTPRERKIKKSLAKFKKAALINQ